VSQNGRIVGREANAVGVPDGPDRGNAGRHVTIRRTTNEDRRRTNSSVVNTLSHLVSAFVRKSAAASPTVT